MKKYAILLNVFFIFIIGNNCLAQNIFKEGTQKYESNNFKGAIIDFEKYIGENKSNKNLIVSAKVDYAYQIAAISSLYICDFEKSKKYLSELLKRADYSNELKYSGNYSLGYIAYVNNDTKTAIRYLNTAIDSYKKNSEALLLRGICYKELGNVVDAEKDFNSLLKNNNSDLTKATALFYLNEREQGIAQMNEIIKSNPSMLNYYQLASLFAINGDTGNSLKNLDLALNKGLNNYPVYIFYDKNFDNFRDNDDYKNLIKKHNLQQSIPPNSALTDNVKSKNTSETTNNQKIISNKIQSENQNSKIVEDTWDKNKSLETVEPYKNEEIRKFLLNSKINGSFIKGTDGSLYIVFGYSLYKLTSNIGDSWSKITDNIKTVSINPDNQDIIYSISDKNRIRKSVDGGKSWRIIENGIPQYTDPYFIVTNPNNADEIFLSASNGLYSTRDAGFSWETILSGMQIERIQFDFYNKDKYYVHKKLPYPDSELLMTVDGGKTWKNIGNNLPKFLTQGAGRTATPKLVTVNDFFFFSDKESPFLLAFTPEGIYKTTNDGENWNLISGDFNKTDNLTSIYATGKEILLACYKRGTDNKIESTLYSINFSDCKCSKINCKIEQGFLYGIAQDNTHKGLFYQLDNKIAYFDESCNSIGLNYGVTQHSIIHDVNYSIIHDTLSIFAIVENKNYIDVDKYGLWKSTDNGLTWKKCLMYNDFQRIGGKKILISPHNSSEIWIIDGTSKYFSTNGGNQWHYAFDYLQNKKNLDDGGRKFYDNIAYLSFDDKDKNVLYYSKGTNEKGLYRFDRTTQNSTLICNVGYNPVFKVDHDNSKNIITANFQISNDGGWTWKTIFAKLDSLMGNRINLNNEDAIPIDYWKNNILIKIGSYFVSSSSNGNEWSISKAFEGRIKSCVINPTNHNNLFLIVEKAEYSSFKGLSVLQTLDGSNWEPILTYSMPSETNSAFVGNHRDYYTNISIVNHSQEKVIYIYGNGGLLHSLNNGKTWQKIGGINENN